MAQATEKYYQAEMADYNRILTEAGINFPEELTSSGPSMGKIRISEELAHLGEVARLQFGQDITDQLLVSTLFPLALEQAYEYDNPDFAGLKTLIDRLVAEGYQDISGFYPLAPELIRLIGDGNSVPLKMTNIDLPGTGLHIPENMRNTITGTVSHVSVNMVTTQEFDAALAGLGGHLSNSVFYDRLGCLVGTCYGRIKSLFSIYGDTLYVMYAHLSLIDTDDPGAYDLSSWEATYYKSPPSIESRIGGITSDLSNIGVLAQTLGLPSRETQDWPIYQLIQHGGISLKYWECEWGNPCDGLVFEEVQK